jgi:multidrug efflux pump subunit AcrA (membrane-fusion protein)
MLRRYLCAKVLLCLVFLIAGCSGIDAPPVAPTAAPTLETTGLTYVVQRGRVTRDLEFTGRVSSVEEVPLYFKVGGYVKRVLIQPGDRVKAGDLLAELEVGLGVESSQDQISAAELDLALAQARLAQAEEANAYAITQAEMALVLAQEELSRTKALRATYTAGTVSARVALEQAQDLAAQAEAEYQSVFTDRTWEPEEVREAAALAHQHAQWNLEIVQARYDQAIAEAGTYRHELKIAEIAVSQVEAELERLRNGVGPVLVIEVQQAQQVLDRLKESSQIMAPVDGEVASLSLYPGQPVESFRPVIVIADPTAIEVSASLSDDQLQGVSEGQKATVALGVNPDHSWAGTIRRLPYPHGTGGSGENPANGDNSTRISLEGDVSELRLGDLVRVTVVLEEKDDALWLPPDAIRTFQGRTFVTVQDGERQRRTDVELGIEGQGRVEILTGLEQGQVIVAP